MEHCDPFASTHHAIASCPAAVLPAVLVLGLTLLALMSTTTLVFRPEFVPLSIDQPPRPRFVR